MKRTAGSFFFLIPTLRFCCNHPAVESGNRGGAMKRFEAKCDNLGRGGDHRWFLQATTGCLSYRRTWWLVGLRLIHMMTKKTTTATTSSSWLVGLKDPMPRFVDLEYVGSWSGLVCVRVWNFSPASMVLWNPARSWRHESREDFEEEEEWSYEKYGFMIALPENVEFDYVHSYNFCHLHQSNSKNSFDYLLDFS
ncbi:hypothetical protein LINGRAHAP2_LOCUS28020 [Linum grandiflorum]